MSISLQVVPKDVWIRDYSESAHVIAFGKIKPKEWDRIDFAFLFIDEEANLPAGYITCREYDHETLYMQFGGSMPGAKGTPKSAFMFDLALGYLSSRYRRVTFLVENTNQPMLKLAMSRDFLVVGLRSFHGTILLEHMREYG